MSIPKANKFEIRNVIDLGTDGRFGPGREADFSKAADEKIFKHCVDRGAIQYPIEDDSKEPVDQKVASGSKAKSPSTNEPEFEGTGEWRTEDGGEGWWRVIGPKGNFEGNKREDEAKKLVKEKNKS